MAKPIHTIELQQPTAQQMEEAKMTSLVHELAQNEQALKKILSIVQQLDHSRSLDAVDSLLKSRTDVSHVVIDQLQKQPAQNLVLLVQALASVGALIDGEQTKAVVHNLKVQQEERIAERQKKRNPVLHVLKLAKDPDVWQAAAFMLVLLKSVGSVLNKK